MKWENHDIDVIELVNNPKFSELDDIVTPLKLDLFFDDVLVDMIVTYNNFYSYREKADISFETVNEKIHLFLSMLLFSGCHNLLARKIYSETTPNIFM